MQNHGRPCWFGFCVAVDSQTTHPTIHSERGGKKHLEKDTKADSRRFVPHAALATALWLAGGSAQTRFFCSDACPWCAYQGVLGMRMTSGNRRREKKKKHCKTSVHTSQNEQPNGPRRTGACRKVAGGPRPPSTASISPRPASPNAHYTHGLIAPN